MSNIFSSLQAYAGNWSVKSSRAFTQEEIALTSCAVVVNSTYGNSCCFFMKSGVMHFIPMSRDSQLTVGETVDLSKAQILTLQKEGEEDITRILEG